MSETLRVLPNPYSFVDQDGEAQGTCAADPHHAAGRLMKVGAEFDLKRTKVHNTDGKGRKMRRQPGDNRPFPQTTKYIFATEPVTIPATAKYLNDIQCGDLIAADAETFAKAFGSRAKFEPAEEQLAAARARAFDDYVAAFGKPPAFTRVAEPVAPADEAPAQEAPAADAPVAVEAAMPALQAPEAPAADATESTTGEPEPAADAPAEAPTGGTQ